MPEYPNNEFLAACRQFDTLLAHLTTLRNDHFGANPETERNWGEVGSVREANRQLLRVIEFLTRDAA